MSVDVSFNNASFWHTETVRHYIIYASKYDVIAFLKQELVRFTDHVNPQSIAFSSFYKGFACLIYDTRTKQIFLVRDHFGLEPFYYTIIQQTKQLCFGSTLPDILQTMPASSLDEAYVESMLADVCVSGLTYTNQTFYHDVLRVTPGTILSIGFEPDVKFKEQVYWCLKPGTPFIRYASDAEYDAHFAQLLEEACRHCCDTDSVAMEFSGGLDTSVILTALNAQNIPAQLFMHTGEVQDERLYGDQLLKELSNHYPVHYVDAEDFDVLTVLDQHKQWFAGGAPYLFFMFAANIHQAVQQRGCKTLLSGFGGDECVSSHALLRTWGL